MLELFNIKECDFFKKSKMFEHLIPIFPPISGLEENIGE